MISTDSLNILQWNVRSLPARSPSFHHLLSHEKCAIALLSETWLHPTRPFKIPYYNLFRSDRPDGYGGAAIATHVSLKVRIIDINPNLKQSCLNNKIDLVGIEVLNTQTSKNIFFWSCYIPPDPKIPTNILKSLFQLINNNCIMGGDFNAHHPAWGSVTSSSRGNQIYDIINSVGLCILNSGSATHLGRPNRPSTAIDISLCSPNLMWSSSWSTTEDPHGSDHFPIIITIQNSNQRIINSPLPSNTNNPTNPSSLPQFNLNKADWNKFSDLIKNNIMTTDQAISPIEAYDQFILMIMKAATESIQFKHKKSKLYPPSPPWWDNTCTQAVNNRNNKFKIYRRTGSINDFYIYNNECASTTRLLKEKKKNAWKQFCSSLNPSSSINTLWDTAKRFRNCIHPPSHPHNDDWFDGFCSKVAPCYVPSETEIPHSNSTINPHFGEHCLSQPISLSELNTAIFSRKSTASGTDLISPLMLQHLPTNAIEALLSILNNLLISTSIPQSWTSYRVIPIPKPHSNNSFRPIAISSSICKLVEYIFKNRLDWWLESNAILPDNLYAFRRGKGTSECLATLIGEIYQSYNNRAHLVSTFIDIRGAFDSVNIPLLLSYLKSLNLPPIFTNFISHLFSHRNLHFLSPFGSTNSRSTYSGLPQGSCLSPILFNIYMSFIVNHLNSVGARCLVYADDIVIFSRNLDIDLAIYSLNNSLSSLHYILSTHFFDIAHEKCKSLIFSRRHIQQCPHTTINGHILPFVSNYTYLGLILDPKLRWGPHITYLTKITSRWANFLRSIANAWWGSHPSSLMTIYKSVIRAKLDYGCFFSGSTALSHCNKLNKLQIACLRSIIGALKSTPSPAIEVETTCQPLNLRCKWLAGKFLLKNLSTKDAHIFNSFLDIFYSWRYIQKSLPVLASMAHSLISTRDHIYNSTKPPLYETNFNSLFLTPTIHFNKDFLKHSINFLKTSPPNFVNSLFIDYIQEHFSRFILIFTDGSSTPLSAGFSFYIPDFHISFSNNLPPTASSYTTECFAIMEALLSISSLPSNNFLIVTDSLSCLQALSSNCFKSQTSALIIKIKLLLFTLFESGSEVQFLWVPGHVGIAGNEYADHLARSTASFRCPASSKIPWSDFNPKLKTCIGKLWLSHWESLPPNFARWYKSISPTIPCYPWFHNINISRKSITAFSRLRFGHTLLPSHSFNLSLNNSPLCTLHSNPQICDISHILFSCPNLFLERQKLISLFNLHSIPFEKKIIFSSQQPNIILSVLSLFNHSGFLI